MWRAAVWTFYRRFPLAGARGDIAVGEQNGSVVTIVLTFRWPEVVAYLLFLLLIFALGYVFPGSQCVAIFLAIPWLFGIVIEYYSLVRCLREITRAA